MVPRLFPASTIVCVGSGPSLVAADILHAACHGAVILAINSAYLSCPSVLPDVLYAPDAQWWGWHPDALDLPCPKFAFQQEAAIYPQLTILGRTGYDGLDTDPRYLRSGGHSGYAAINLAVHLGARAIVLLGYDYCPDARGAHHFSGGDHPDGSHVPYDVHLAVYDTLVAPLAALNITIVNASRVSTITAFPCATLAEVLSTCSR